MNLLPYTAEETHLHVHRSGVTFHKHNGACDYVPVCVLQADLSVSHTLPAGDLGFKNMLFTKWSTG